MISKLYVASVGDVHLGHPNTPTAKIIEGLKAAFPDTEETGLLDIIFFEGDLFDRQIQTSDPTIDEIQYWMRGFLKMCEKRNISVRVLEGTPSHDWTQPRLFLTVAALTGVEVDLVYINDVRIERHPLGCTILYVPDEWKPDTNDTYLEVCDKLREQGLDQVDLAIMHGAFEYQLPELARAPVHNARSYLDLVRHYVFIGHIHKHTTYQRILAAGSFDRLAHGEEDPKGHFRVKIDQRHGDEIVFVENKLAQTYLTVDCTGLTLDGAFEKLEVATTLRHGSYIRVEADRDDPILVNIELMRRKYPDLVWSTKASAGTHVQASLLVDLRQQYREIQLSQSNLLQLLHERMVSKGIPPEVIACGMGLLTPVL
jgi:hypothetical protein